VAGSSVSAKEIEEEEVTKVMLRELPFAIHCLPEIREKQHIYLIKSQHLRHLY
jgi:hypothetical protein